MLINTFAFFPPPIKYYHLWWLKWLGRVSSFHPRTNTQKYTNKNLSFKLKTVLTSQSCVSWVFKIVQNQVLLLVYVPHLSLTWSFTNLILTTVVYFKQNDIFRALLIAVYLPLWKNGDLKEQKDPSFIRAKLNVRYTGKWSNRPSEFLLFMKSKAFLLRAQ